ncbi:MAG TPA: M14 family zinc carboxypeptidase [Gemmatimonadales bacterium]|nr:M14 family zinc carboxypeptidase [Gemmatimonadales bacterium]
MHLLLRSTIQAAVLYATIAGLPNVSTAQDQPCCLHDGLRIAARYRVEAIDHRRFTSTDLWNAIGPYLAAPGVRTEDLARSVGGWPIRAVTVGTGPTSVLLWSQMHGDESTATMALADIIRFFAEGSADPLQRRLTEHLTITMVPMLNPDGAQRFARENALGIDLNRDARRLVTPEARALKGLRDRLQADFGFNLHDQGVRRTAGPTGLQVAIALLAPAADEEKSYGPTRQRARLVAATMADVLNQQVPGRLAKWDDSFEPRAFGDLMQQWGTSTVLIESGGLPDDPEKQNLRTLNVVALLTAFDAIASGRYETANPDVYEQLPFNLGVEYDLLLAGGRIVAGTGDPMTADIALVYDDPVAGREIRVEAVGDLDRAEAMDTLDITGLYVHPEPGSTTTRHGMPGIRLGHRAAFTVRRGTSPDSEVVHEFRE